MTILAIDTSTTAITVALHDSGGTANGGVDTSTARTFTITLTPTNQAPVDSAGSLSTLTGTPAVGQLSSTSRSLGPAAYVPTEEA